MICVYALVSPPLPRLKLTGIAGERLHVVTSGPLSAVVGEIGRAPAPTVRTLRRYAVVVESIAARADAVLPARFVTTVADDGEVVSILQSRRASLRQRLRAVRLRSQMTIRFVAEPEPESKSEPGDGPSRSPSPTAGRARLRLGNEATPGTQYLRRRMAIAVKARSVSGFTPVREAVRRFVKDERVERRGDVVTINHLVPRTAVERYRTAVIRAAEASGVRLVVTGPLAPYAFTDNG